MMALNPALLTGWIKRGARWIRKVEVLLGANLTLVTAN